MENWFDPITGIFKLDEILLQRESFRKIMGDGFVSEEELKMQSELVINKLKEIETKLTEENKNIVSDAIAEMAVLFAVYQYSQIQQIKR